MNEWSIATASEQQTQELGRCIGELIDQPVLLLLQGDLGAGKSVLARGVARGLGVPDRIPVTSPTFTLMNHYTARLPLYHFDLYRLSDPDELIELGFDEFAHGSGVSLVEWPERIEDSGFDRLRVQIQRLDEERRRLQFHARGSDSRRLLRRLAAVVESDD